MRDVSRENIGKRMAILLFEKGKGEVVTAPVIRGELGSRFQISGRMTHGRGQRHRAAAARRLAGRADGDHRGAHDRPEPGRREHRQGLPQRDLRLRRDRALHVRCTTCCSACSRRWRSAFNLLLLVARAVDAAGDADAARHRRHRADARHGDRRQRADQRARARGTARRRLAAGGDQHRLRARLRDHPRLERDDADRRPGAARLRLRAGARLRGRALPGHPDLDVLGGDVLARPGQPLVRPPEAA